MTSKAPRAADRRPVRDRSRSAPPVFAIAVAALVVIAVAVLVVIKVTGGDSDDGVTTDGGSSGSSQAVAPVVISGDPLPESPDTGEDPAVGEPAPIIEGETPSGEPITIDPAEDGPMLLAFVAHWCPHCQAEVPRIVELVDDNGELDGVKVVGVSTASDERRGNYPPGEWLDREQWPGPVLLDSEASEAAASYGLSSYPFLVAIDAEGNVVARASGEQGEERLRALFEAARTGET